MTADDFASGAIIRLIRAGLTAQRLPVPQLPPSNAAHVPLDAKRRLLKQLAADYGSAVLLRIADALHGLPLEPGLRALTLATGPADLLARWNRLERFIHSRHRIVWRERHAGAIELEHVSSATRDPPVPEEDTLVFAILTVLCEMTDTVALVAGPPEAIWRQNGRWVWEGALSTTRQWRLTFAADVARAPAGDRLARNDPRHRVRALIEGDPSRVWTVEGTARALGYSRRTLQRQLAADGTSVRQLVNEVRMAVASGLLSESRVNLSEIGFACGFSDQAHFTRSFRRFNAMTPAAYRQQFAR